MPLLATFEDAEQALATYRPAPTEAVYTLERVQAFLNSLSQPQNSYRAIHVAGTSGKTSTSYYIAGLLKQAGYKVGLTVSPYVDALNEQAQINLELLPERQYAALLGEYLEIVDASDIKLTYFEVLVAFAYWRFARENVDYAVIEVGLGGLLDATNVMDRADKICAITDIGLDHTEILGDTLAAIAYQKAGIILPGNTVFMHAQAAEVTDVVHQVCVERSAALYISKPASASSVAVDLPAFQHRNFALARAVVEYSLRRDGRPSLSQNQLLAAAAIIVPGRMEIVSQGNKTVVLDGSHNEQKVTALTDSMLAQYGDAKLGLLVSFGANKLTSVEASLRELRRLSDTIIITTFTPLQNLNRVAIEPKILADLCRRAGFINISCVAEPAAAYTRVMAQYNTVLVTGSYFLLYDVRPLVC